jgi:YVTN family beta-propeller protein
MPPVWAKSSTLAYVANAGTNNVQILDLDTGQTINTLYAGTAPWRLVPSPDGKRLMVQNWYAATTAVVDLATNRIEAVLPSRGPGVFTPKGDRFVTYSWPGSFRETYNAKTLDRVDQRQTEDRMVYDLRFWGKNRLFFGQYDPVATSARTVFDQVGVADLSVESEGSASIKTGTSPAKLVFDPKGEYLFTANVDDRDVTIINENGATARVTVGAGPREVLFADGGKRLIVLCWAKNARVSEIFTLNVDLKARPWPTFTAGKTLRVPAGLVAGAMAPDGRLFYALDRLGNRLVTFDAESLEEQQSFAVGEEPSAFVLRTVSARERTRLSRKSASRVELEKTIAQMKSRGTTYHDVSFIETSTSEVPDDSKDPPSASDPAAKPSTKTVTSTTKTMVRLPDSVRQELGDGAVRLAQGGRTIFVDKAGRFIETPRQDLLYALYALYGLPVEEVVRQLAGDVPGSPWLRNGIAVDIMRTVEEEGHRYYAIGAMGDHDRVSQLWVSAETGLPVSLIEQFPVMRPSNPHGEGAGFGGLTETRLRYAKQAGGQLLPTRLSRYIDGKEVGIVDVTDVVFDQNPSPDRFDLARLGGVLKPAPKKPATARVSVDDGPGVAVVGLGNDHIDSPFSPHAAYNSNPPTSGPHTPYIAPWGVHSVPIPPETQVHNLEDGGVLLQYSCATPCLDLVRDLERASGWHERVIVAPFPLMEHRIVLTAWERIETLETFDEERVTAFIDAYAGKDHHPPGGEPGSNSTTAKEGQ